MAKETQSAGGGVFIAIATLIGAIAGAVSGQASIGVLAGAAAGIGVALLLWVRDRRRIGR